MHHSYGFEHLEPRQLLTAAPIDGFGNNPLHPEWGSTHIELLRIADAEYGDGISSPAGSDRPSARFVSNTVVSQSSSTLNSRGLTDLTWMWGQFIDHDLDLSDPASPAESFTIEVPQGDPWFDPSATGSVSIPLDRSDYVAGAASSDGRRQQLNTITSWIDGSNVYGSDATRATALRTGSGGLLRTSVGDLLPFNVDGLPNAGGPSASLFLAGDVRANENIGLTSMHTIFVREHNRIAHDLAISNPLLTDQELYDQARSIVVGEIQAITYNEFLPALLGPDVLTDWISYDASVNPGITNEFSTAAYRFGHTMLSPELQRLDTTGTVIPAGNIPLRQAFFNPQEVIDNGIDPLLQGAAAQQAQEIDAKIIDDVRNFLFGPPGSGGLDLASLNIQRGRDHGLADYNATRVALGLPAVTTFSEISSDALVVTSLQATYGSVDEIDLWVGGLAEDHLNGSSMGETFTAIISEQFRRLRDGDRFWYENVFDGTQLEEIRNTRLSDVISRNSAVQNLQTNAFFMTGMEPVTLTLTDTTSHDIKVSMNGDMLEVWDSTAGRMLLTRHSGEIASLAIECLDAFDDTLTIDLSGGNPIPWSGLTFDAGKGNYDKLVITGGTFNSVIYNATGTDGLSGDGDFELDGSHVWFTGLEPIDLTSSTIVDYTINVDPSANIDGPITTSIVAVGTDTRVSFDNGLESTLFGTLTGTLTVNGDNIDSDTFLIEGVGSDFTGNLTINGLGGLDSVAFQSSAASLVNADIEVNAESVAITAPLNAGSGNISFTTDSISIGAEITGTGSLTIAPQSLNATIGIGGGIGTLNIDDAELMQLSDGFSEIIIGDVAGGTGNVFLQSATFPDPVTIAGGTIFDAVTTSQITSPSVTLVGNVAPVIRLNADHVGGADLSIAEGNWIVLTGTILDPDNSNTFTMTVDWGDATSPLETVMFNESPAGSQAFWLIHSYADDPPGATDDYIITVTLSDSAGASSIASTVATVSNTPPHATDDGPDQGTPSSGNPFSTNERQIKTIDVTGNDFDSAGLRDPLTIVAINGQPVIAGETVALTSGSLVTLNTDGTVSYNPNNAFFQLTLGQTALDVFSYTIDDGDGGQSTANITVTVIGDNDIWVDVNNDGAYNPADGDVDVRILAEDGIFDARYSTGTYQSVAGAGIGINASLNLNTAISYTADGTISVFNSQLTTSESITLTSQKQNVAVSGSQLVGANGISILAVRGSVLIAPATSLTAAGTAQADIVLSGYQAVDVSSALLTGADQITLLSSGPQGSIRADQTTATAHDLKFWTYDRFSAVEAVLDATGTIQIEALNGAGILAGASLTATAPGASVTVKTYRHLNGSASTSSMQPLTVHADAGISLTASFGQLTLTEAELRSNSGTQPVKLLSRTAIDSKQLLVSTPGDLSITVYQTDRKKGYNIDATNADLTAASIILNAQDGIIATNLSAAATHDNLELIAHYSAIDASLAHLAAAGNVRLDAGQDSLMAVASTITAGALGSGSITAIGRNEVDLTGIDWTSPTSISVSALRPEDGSEGGWMKADNALLTAAQVSVFTSIKLIAVDLDIQAIASAEISSHALDYNLQGAHITATVGPVTIAGRKIDLSASHVRSAVISGNAGVTIKASYNSILANNADIHALGTGAEILMQANKVDASIATITADSSVRILAQYQVNAATDSTIDLDGADVRSLHRSVDVRAKGAVRIPSAVLSAVDFVSLFSQYDYIDIHLAQLTATQIGGGNVTLESSGNQNAKQATLKADKVTLYAASGEIDATDAVFARFADPSSLNVIAKDDIFLTGSLRQHLTESVYSSGGQIHY